jgi:hypothetical protein
MDLGTDIISRAGRAIQWERSLFPGGIAGEEWRGVDNPPLPSKKVKGKVMSLQPYGAQRVLGGLRLPDSMTSALDGGRLSAIRTGRLHPHEYPGTHFKRLSRPRAHGIVGCHGKNPQ